MISAVEGERPGASVTDRAVAAVGLIMSGSGLAGMGLFGNALLYFYMAYGVATLGVLVLLLVAVRSQDLRMDGIPWAIRAAIVVAVALAVRAFLYYHGPLLSFDLHWYADYVRFMQMHAKPYTAQFYFPYPQGFLDFLLPFVKSVVPLAAIHWALIAVDCLVALGLLVVLDRSTAPSFGFWGALAYALMPMTALEVGRIGHFETLLNLCFVGLLLGLRGRRAFWAAFAVVAAACLKVFPIIVAPAVIHAWHSKRSVVYSLLGGFVALLLSFLPVLPATPRIVAFWLGSSSSSPQAAGTFVANSLPALGADVPPAAPLVAAAQAVAFIVFVLLVGYAIRSARNGAPDGAEGALRLGAAPSGTGGYRIAVWMPSSARFAIAAMLAALLVYGCYLLGKPWAPSQYAYSWWSPTALLIGLGTALIGLALIGFYSLSRDTTPLVPVQALAALMSAVLTFAILLRANVNPWYLMPVALLLLAMLPSRFAVVALGCIMTFYACYNSSSFTSLGWNDVITAPQEWQVTSGAEPGTQPAGRVVSEGVLSEQHGRMLRYRLFIAPNVRKSYVLVQYGRCAPPVAVFNLVARGQVFSYARPVLNGAAITTVPAALGSSVGLNMPADRCKPAISLVLPQTSPARVETRSNNIAITMPETRTAAGWGHSVSVTSDTFAYAFPNTALAFDVRGDVDPTFHYWPYAISVYVSGRTVDGRKSGQVPVLSRDTGATKIGPIHYRIPLFNLPARLNTIERVTILAQTVGTDSKMHTIQISHVRLVNEERWGSWTAEATAMVLAGVLAALAIVYYFVFMSLRKNGV
jgi:hypothetical protein